MKQVENPNLAHYFLDRQIEAGKGERCALRTDDGDWSYREVQQLSLAFAKQLEERGLRREERVLLVMRDGAPWVGVFFATLRLGAVVVMANPDLSDEAIAQLTSYTRAQILAIDDPKRIAALQSVLDVDHDAADLPRVDIWDVPALSPDELCINSGPIRCSRTHPDESAIWLFSGGTTGRPKAVMQSHAAFRYTTEKYAHAVLSLTKDDVVISVPKLFFGYATGANLLFPFSVGATAVLMRERSDARRLAERIFATKATVMIHVPTLMGKMLDDPQVKAKQLASLRLATSAGEALPESLYRRWKEKFGVEVLDGLGTAEMWHIFLTNRPGDVRPGTLGRVVDGFEIRLCDDDGNDVAPGDVGWLWVRGGARALGYWLEQEKSAQAFRGSWYVSGDMLRQDRDGYYSYCGRGDDMIKVSGKWLTPAEVENVLVKHPCVASAIVVGAEDAKGLQKPYAFVTGHDEAAMVSEDELRRFVAEQLEPYKSPRAIFSAASWPQTHLGKTDRKRLKELVPQLLAKRTGQNQGDTQR